MSGEHTPEYQREREAQEKRQAARLQEHLERRVVRHEIYSSAQKAEEILVVAALAAPGRTPAEALDWLEGLMVETNRRKAEVAREKKEASTNMGAAER